LYTDSYGWWYNPRTKPNNNGDSKSNSSTDNQLSVETPLTQSTPEQPQTTPTEIPAVEMQQQLTETKTETPASTEAGSPVSQPVFDIPVLHYPFFGNFPVTFSFGAQTTNEETKQKFKETFI